MQAIILAGGFGTRLRGVVSEVPKPMAPIAGTPFLALLLSQLQESGFTDVVLSVGYLHETIVTYFGDRFGSLSVRYAIEDRPLGTGGAICRAMQMGGAGEVFVLNGDTFLDLDYQAMLVCHHAQQADISLALKPLEDTARYGNVRVEHGRVVRFEEKGLSAPGLINAGVYVVNRGIIESREWPEVFSFERDFLALSQQDVKLCGYVSDTYFIDIGVPEDFQRAQVELPCQIRHAMK
ncbi:MAG: nucleotidyltransferase family protein [Nitrosomonadales bacterium]|nr:nucleotidyltransferase family protein [Nitrosomonadales bacterium]